MPETNYIATSTELTATANAIRAKTGSAASIEWEQDDGFANAIGAIQTGVSGLKNALCFSSPSSFTLAIGNNTAGWDGTIEWTDGTQPWAIWDGTSTLSASTGVLYLRGTGNEYITGSEGGSFVLTGTNISCVGNIETLLDYATVALGNHPTMGTGCYKYLFADCTNLIFAPILPATTLTSDCYNSMFTGCTGLLTAPKLSATILADYCYSYMFNGCVSLTSAPALPATTLAQSCYEGMFMGCSGLISAPALPATTLIYGCYSYMFNGCTSLMFAPVLPATTLASYCYSYMFFNCPGLTTAPELPATTLKSNCYSNMFVGCTGLESLPVLPATTLQSNCYSNMFSGCTGIKLSTTYDSANYPYALRIPESGTGTTATNALLNMFAATGGSFKGTPTINTVYYLDKPLPVDFTVDGNTAASDIASGKIAYANGTRIVGTSPPVTELENALCFSSPSSFTLQIGTYGLTAAQVWNHMEWTNGTQPWTTWDGSTTLTASNGKLYLRGTGNTSVTGYHFDYEELFEDVFIWFQFTGTDIECHGNIETLLDYETVAQGNHPTMDAGCYGYLFYNSPITTAPYLPATTLAYSCYNSMFRGCTALTSAPALPATTLTESCYQYMFYGCTALTSAPALPATTLAIFCYSSMFYDCTALTSTPALPATTLARSCYNGMFRGCTTLTSAPALPATTLVIDCYDNMFYGCTALTSAPALPATTLASSCYSSMFYGCTALTSAPVLPATTLTDYCYSSMFRGCSSIKLSTTYDSTNYPYALRIPESGTGTTATSALANMFTNTGGSFTGTPSINTVYYLSKPLPIDFTIDGNAAAADILSGKISYANGSRVVGSIASKSSTDLTVSGATVTAPAGYYNAAASKAVASGSAKPPSSISGSSATVSTGTNTLTLSKTISVTPTVTAGYVSTGIAGNVSVSLTGSVTTKAAATITPTTSNQTIAAGTYLTGAQTIAGNANLVAGNIKNGVSIFGVTGNYAGQSLTYVNTITSTSQSISSSSSVSTLFPSNGTYLVFVGGGHWQSSNYSGGGGCLLYGWFTKSGTTYTKGEGKYCYGASSWSGLDFNSGSTNEITVSSSSISFNSHITGDSSAVDSYAFNIMSFKLA